MKISICKNYNPGELKDFNNDKVSHGWEAQEIAWKNEDIVDLTTKCGISCNEYSDGHRCSDSWIAAHNIMLDFDDGRMTQETLLEKQKHWDFNSYIFSSQNHQKPKNSKHPCDRLRVLIPLEEPITSNLDLEAVKNIILEKFPLTDKGCMEKARWFAHGTILVRSFVGDKKFLNWKGLLKSNKSNTTAKKDEDDIYTFSLETELKDINKKIIKVKGISEKTIIYCPICGEALYRNNDGHNAFIDINSKGLYFIFCSSCETRGNGVNGKGIYNLNSADAYLLKTKELGTAVFIDRNNCQLHSVTVEKGKVMIDLIKSQYYAEQYCKSKSLPIPKSFPHVRLEHRFDSDEIVNFKEEFVNKYIAPDVLKSPIPEEFKAKMPKYIGRLIDHIFAGDLEIINRFINDLAYLTQTRKKLITSYLMSGTEGTGKGVFFKLVLRKMFGERYCAETDMDAFDSRFNDFLTDNFLVLVSEVSANFTAVERRGLSIVEKIKMAITDQSIQIEGKGQKRFNGNNNCSFLFATNRRHGIVLSNDDRRFNVAPRQEQKIINMDWWPGYPELVDIINSELQNFVWFLKSYVVNYKLIGVVINNSSKELLQAMSTTDCEDFFDALNKGDGDWFAENLVKKYGYDGDDRFENIKSILRGLKDDEFIETKRLCEIYNYVNNKNLSVKSFLKLARLHLKTEIVQIKKSSSERPRGIKISMKFSDSIF